MPEEITTFEAFGLDQSILEAVARLGYVTPTPIQASAIPKVLAGRDIMGAAQTGTGKTAGFALPVIERLLPTANTSASPARHPVRALVLCPTRELAMQNEENIRAYASLTKLRVAVVYGGVDIREQANTMRMGAEILIATPGRLLDLIEQKITNLASCGIVVLDEADRMLDMGFLPDISRILALLPKARQSLMFSATFSPEIKSLAANFLKNPELVEVARENSVATTISQHFYETGERTKRESLIHILNEKHADLTPALVFVNAKLTARRLTRELVRAGIVADAIHGDRTQEERTTTLEAFKAGKTRCLVATDVAARGLDISSLPLVVNFDVPFNPEDYVHRIGRTGRAGQEGQALTLVAGEDDRKNVSQIEKLTGLKFSMERLTVGSRRSAPQKARSEQRYAERAPAREVDPFFDKPYEASGRKPEVRPEPVARPPVKKPARRLAALLGGFTDDDEG